MKNRTRTAKRCSLLSLLFPTFLMVMFFCTPAYAGSINGNEQSIVSVINGQFEQDGVIYKVRQEYINSAMSYLQQDDVDLTAEQAQSVISEIYSNVQTGVDSGYLERIGQTAPPETAPAESPKSGETGNNGSKNPDGQETDGNAEAGNQLGESTESGEPTGETVGDGQNGGDGTDNPDGSGSEEPQEVIPPTPEVISILELVDKAPPQSYEYLSKDTDALMAHIHIPYQTLWYIIILLAAVIAIIAAVSLLKKLFVHHHNRKLRKFFRFILAAEIGVLSAVCFSAVSVWIGAFQDSAVLNKLADTGYYRTIFEELRRDTSISFALLDIPDNVMDSAITYERVVLAARQQVESDLSQGAYQADTSVLTDQLEADIRSYLEGRSVTMTEQAQTGLDELMSRLDQKYSSLLKWPFAAWWIEMKTEFFAFAKIALPLSLLLAILSQALIIGLNHYKHRGVILGGKGLMGGGLITAAAFGAGMVIIGQNLPKVTPDYMELFFKIYGNGLCRTGMITGVIGVLLGVIVLVAVHTWKDSK